MNDKTMTSFVLYKSKFQMPEQISLRDIIKCFNDEEKQKEDGAEEIRNPLRKKYFCLQLDDKMKFFRFYLENNSFHGQQAITI